MKSALVVLGIVVFIGLALPDNHSVAAYLDSAEFNAFVRPGLVGSADFSLDGAVAASNEGWPQLITSNVTCNGVPFAGSKCVGEALVNNTIMEAKDQKMFFLRYCDGVYTKKTIPIEGGPGYGNTIEQCAGKTLMDVRISRKNEEIGRWTKKYIYIRTCFFDFVFGSKISPSGTPGRAIYEMYTNCDASSITTFTSTLKKFMCGSGKKDDFDVPAKCNDKRSTINQPCEGRFEIALPKKSSSRFGRVLMKKQGGWTCNDRNWTFICDGKWKPQGGQYFECDGLKQEYEDMAENNFHSSRNCTGRFGSSLFSDQTKGYKVCLGDSTFDETMTISVPKPPS